MDDYCKGVQMAEEKTSRISTTDLRAGATFLLVGSVVMGLAMASWEPTPSTDTWVVGLMSMGWTFVPVLAAISLALIIVAFALPRD